MILQRQETIDLLIVNPLSKRLRDNIKQIQHEFEQNRSVILSDFFAALDMVSLKAKELQSQNKKGTVTYLCISYLTSSLLTGSHAVRMDGYDASFYADLEEAASYWYPNFIFKYFEQDILYVREYLRKSYLDHVFVEYEITAFKKRYVANYYHMLRQFCQDQVEEIKTRYCHQSVSWHNECKILFGGYMEQTILLVDAEDTVYDEVF